MDVFPYRRRKRFASRFGSRDEEESGEVDRRENEA
jgi:hypothetical protein